MQRNKTTSDIWGIVRRCIIQTKETQNTYTQICGGISSGAGSYCALRCASLSSKLEISVRKDSTSAAVNSTCK